MVDLPGNDGANEGFWRFQIRDKRGNWIKMGGSVTFSTNHPNFGPISGNGTFEGGARPSVALIRVSDDHPTLGGKVVEVPSEDLESVKAIIPADAPGLAEAKRLDALDGIIVNAPTKTPELKDSMTGDEVLQKIAASMGKLAKSEGRFPVGRSKNDVKAAAKETYKTVYEKLKVEYPELAAAYPDYESYWARASNGLAAGWTTRWADSVDDIDALTKASNKIYAREILGLKEDGLIEFYRNAVNHMKDEDLAASGYASLDRRMAWDYNSYISQYKDNGLNATDGRYIVRARPDEVTGLIGFSQVEDEYGVVIGTDVVSQKGRKERVGDLEVQTIAPWSGDLKEFDRSGGGSPFRRISPASQFDVYATDNPVPGDEYSDFYVSLGLDPKSRPIPTKWDEMFGEGSFEALENRYPSYRTIKSYFVDAGNGKVGLDMIALDRVSSRNSADPKAGDEYDTHLKMLSVIQELSGKTFMVHRGHSKEDPRIPEPEPVIEAPTVEEPTAVVSPEIAKATEPWKDVEPGIQDRGSFTLEKNVYGVAVDFTGLESPVTAVDPEMISEYHAAAIRRYTSNRYRFINTYLRFNSEFQDSDKADTKDMKATISAMDEMIEENGEVFEASRVFRGQILYDPLKSGDTNWIDVMENLEVGDVISDPGYMSTSNDPLVSFRDFGPGSGLTTWLDDDSVWSKNAVGRGAVFWMIDVPEGSKAFALPNEMGQGQGAEREVILPRNSQLRVKGIRRVAQQDDFYDPNSTNGQYNYYVETELIPQDAPGVIDVVDKTAEDREAGEELAIRDILSSLNIETPGISPKPDQDADYEKIKEQVNNIYKDKSFAGYNIKFDEAKPTKITYAFPGEPAAGFKVLGYIYDGNKKIGRIIRSFGVTPSGDFIAAHDEIALYYAENKGKGFSLEFSKFSEDLYRKNGIKEIQLVAGDYDGAYVWAKAGYSWLRKPDDLAKWLLDKSKEFQYEDTVPNMSDADREMNQNRIEDIANKLKTGEITDADYPTPFEIANLAGPDIDGMSYARWLLLEAEWFGRKIL